MNSVLPELGADGRILEGIVTTLNEDGSVNISPMGPIVDEQFTTFLFRPYNTSTTYKNLKRTKSGVFHLTDDVLLFAQAAIGTPSPLPELQGLILADACRWFQFDVQSLDDSQERTEIVATMVAQGRNRDFLGFNRAKHAVIEAAILATRVHLLPAAKINAELEQLVPLVQKTGGSAEHQAFAFLREHIATTMQSVENVESSP